MDFSKALEVRKGQSSAEVIGRAEMEDKEAADRIFSSQSAERILDVLLACENQEERHALQQEAFLPPESTAQVVFLPFVPS